MSHWWNEWAWNIENKMKLQDERIHMLIDDQMKKDKQIDRLKEQNRELMKLQDDNHMKKHKQIEQLEEQNRELHARVLSLEYANQSMKGMKPLAGASGRAHRKGCGQRMVVVDM